MLSPGLCGELSSKGRLKASRFTWENAAAQSLRFFERAAQ
jgi:hypothetical protein